MVAAMASIRLAPPEPFDFSKPDEWPRWKRRFEQFGFVRSALKNRSRLGSHRSRAQPICMFNAPINCRVRKCTGNFLIGVWGGTR